MQVWDSQDLKGLFPCTIGVAGKIELQNSTLYTPKVQHITFANKKNPNMIRRPRNLRQKWRKMASYAPTLPNMGITNEKARGVSWNWLTTWANPFPLVDSDRLKSTRKSTGSRKTRSDQTKAKRWIESICHTISSLYGKLWQDMVNCTCHNT